MISVDIRLLAFKVNDICFHDTDPKYRSHSVRYDVLLNSAGGDISVLITVPVVGFITLGLGLQHDEDRKRAKWCSVTSAVT